ncbi:aldehyde dehydrogenase family protein [Leptospira selangorensis]|uniref:L-glutamate gamma-semialdehyde dehydrogenase n=1 Tax=Leptospira selangorensis TaxID=2484982 RepID=A0A5F2BXN7_9LEPT|nr:aldehyde dehydrogenase family protein [Leptospira selangorensis]TGM12116.1 aldehyde dehydrogenase family protein [Leptospira selangorensis]TGM14841.1 aldehyde dehydrogenase family protein [Leptospira selangorensis]
MNFHNNSNFQNETLRDFSREEERSILNNGFASIRKEFPVQVFPIISGKTKKSSLIVPALNPANTSEKIADIHYASVTDAEEAVKDSVQFFEIWKNTKPEVRIGFLKKAADILRSKKAELTALISLEVGKGVKDIDAEIAEAIDFCEFYAKEAEHIFQPRKRYLLGEENIYTYIPRGVTLVVAPWNFPLAILCGMTVAPLVAGNPVIMKPAEQSSAIAFKLFNILIEAGIPSSALHFLPGKGEEIGAYLVKHPEIHTINFTGSRAVGLGMIREAASQNLKFVKKVIAEMGGKNALIVDEDADLDEAVIASIQSAFGFQGQKCSALSRIILLESKYDTFKNRFIDALQSLKPGLPEDPSVKVGPVIDSESKKRLDGIASQFSSKILSKLEMEDNQKHTGHFVEPIIFESEDPISPLGQTEFFGPYVALFKAKNFEEAIKIANNVDYALTGGVFSRNPKNIQYAKENFEVGNLYINRGITGAVVDRQPFGGYKLSGVGAKAGGPDYLKQFLEPISITENTMRRGFIPET